MPARIIVKVGDRVGTCLALLDELPISFAEPGRSVCIADKTSIRRRRVRRPSSTF